MCGIVGAVARENVVPILIEGVRRLEYRGYDSTGLAVINGGLHRLVSTARVADLAKQARRRSITGLTGISHTRWATHGAPTPANAHPHTSSGEIAVVHNGIIENFESLRERLRQQGYQFVTQTDSEVIAHLIHAHYQGDLLEAVRNTVAEFKGAYAIAAISTREPGRIVGARAGSPLLVGIGEQDHFLASDASALASVTQRVAYLEEGDVADIRRESYAIYDAAGAQVARAIVTVPASSAAVELGPYRHFMQKEIFEQPRAIADTLESVGGIGPDLFGADAAAVFAKVKAVHLLACGTSYYSAMLGATVAGGRGRHSGAGRDRQRISLSRQRAESRCAGRRDLAIRARPRTRWRRSSTPSHLVITTRLTICNVATSSMVRQTALTYLTRAGAEIGVASTKAFTTQLAALFLLTLTLAKLRGRLTPAAEARWLAGLRHLPAGDPVGARPRAIDHRLGRAVRKKAERVVPRARAALPGRPRRRAQAQGDFLHPRRGVSRGRTQARSAGAGRQQHAGRCHRAQRRADRKAQVEPAGSSRARWRTLCRGRCRQPYRIERRRSRAAPAGARRAAVADRPHDPAATARVSHRGACAAPTSTSRGIWRRA